MLLSTYRDYRPYGRKNRRTFLASWSAITSMRRLCWRMSVGRLDIPCFLLAGLNLTLPVAVREKRFLAPLLVFILGILLPYGSGCSSAAWACPSGAVAAFPTGLARGRGVIAGEVPGNKAQTARSGDPGAT